MCVFAALWASKGVAGFMRTRERVSKGGGGFIWARKSSPCCAVSSRKREIVRPARSQHPKFSVFVRAGASFFSEEPFEGLCWASIFAPTGTVPVLDAAWRILGWLRWGFCAMRSPLAACRRRVGGLDGVIPPGWWRRGRGVGDHAAVMAAGPIYWRC